jgi:hypothetical protein
MSRTEPADAPSLPRGKATQSWGISFYPADLAALAQLCAADTRNRSQEVRWLIRQEMMRRTLHRAKRKGR